MHLLFWGSVPLSPGHQLHDPKLFAPSVGAQAARLRVADDRGDLVCKALHVGEEGLGHKAMQVTGTKPSHRFMRRRHGGKRPWDALGGTAAA